MSEFVTVARVDQIAEGQGRTFRVGNRDVAVFRLDGKFFALDDLCPHMGASLGQGDVWQDAVVCARHMWAFRLCDGVCIDVPTLKAEAFEVRVEGDEVQVRVPGDEPQPSE